MKTIKQIDTHRYQVELVETDKNQYVIKHYSKIFGVPSNSENIKDFNTASFLFDLKVEEYEGN